MSLCCVIGGNGFIGQHLAPLFISQGKSVIIIDKKTPSSDMSIPGVKYYVGDYGNKSFLYSTLKGVDEIIDLAYASVPKTSFEDPAKDILDNLPASINLFEVASSLPIKKIVIVSSGGTVYGKAVNLPMSEDHPTNPISPYGITKLAVEKYSRMYHVLKGLPVVCVRPANAYGEGQKPFIAQGFVATAVASALKGHEISVFGEVGTIRDYIYVKDIVKGIAMVLNHGRLGECYNIGTGIGTNNRQVLEIIAAIAKLQDIALRVKFMPQRKYDVFVNILDSSKLKNETGWIPTVSLNEGLKLTWQYFKKQYNL